MSRLATLFFELDKLLTYLGTSFKKSPSLMPIDSCLRNSKRMIELIRDRVENHPSEVVALAKTFTKATYLFLGLLNICSTSKEVSCFFDF